MTNYFIYYESAIGLLELHAHEHHLISCKFVEEKNKAEFANQILIEAEKQLNEYFSGVRKKFELSLQFKATAFQEQVWQALASIPYGKCETYLSLAKRLGNAKAIRAVGTTNGKNPFHIILPCHRVVGSDGDLVGYVGGLAKKQWLLDFEAKHSGLYLF